MTAIHSELTARDGDNKKWKQFAHKYIYYTVTNYAILHTIQQKN